MVRHRPESPHGRRRARQTVLHHHLGLPRPSGPASRDRRLPGHRLPDEGGDPRGPGGPRRGGPVESGGQGGGRVDRADPVLAGRVRGDGAGPRLHLRLTAIRASETPPRSIPGRARAARYPRVSEAAGRGVLHARPVRRTTPDRGPRGRHTPEVNSCASSPAYCSSPAPRSPRRTTSNRVRVRADLQRERPDRVAHRFGEILATRPDDQLLGRTEFGRRGLVHRPGAAFFEAAPDEREKGGTGARARSARGAPRTPT
ncbi:MAG: hypothetical protein JWO38_4770 [Gemmataceae bacterium]|nr:hypothetical protein [Gemmataceae bacterium]